MRRTFITAAAVAIAGLLAAAPALGAATIPGLFARQIHKINAAAHGPNVLLPDSMPLSARHLYASGGPSGASYDLELGAVKNCDGANACFVAAFLAHKGGKVFGRKVTVTGASKAGYVPLSCGASCSPPQVDFVVGGVLYSIQADLGKRSKAKLITAAEQAIAAGPRT
jgi:hypothetical protein